MAQHDRRSGLRRGGSGGTTGTGGPDASADPIERNPDERQADAASLAAGDDSAEAAIGGGRRGIAGTGGSAARSGRLTGEGGALPNPPDPGDPGGMGGVRAAGANPRHRPPGGVSPVEKRDES